MKTLRTLYFVPSTEDTNRAWHTIHILPALTRKSSELIYYNPLKDGTENLEQIESTILKLVKKHKISFFFSLTTQKHLAPQTITKMRELGVKCVNFSSDNLDYSNVIQKTAPAYDLCWVTEPEAVPILRRYGARVIHLSYGADPNIFAPVKTPELYDASFCGFKNSSRPKYIYNLLEDFEGSFALSGKGWDNVQDIALNRSTSNLGYTLKHIGENLLFPEGWRNIAVDALNILLEPRPDLEIQERVERSLVGPLRFDEYIKLYSQTRVSLGFNEKGNSYHLPWPVFQTRLRDFEAPMSGACYLMYRLPEMQEYYKENTEMLFYSSPEEMREKIVYYSQERQASQRKKIRTAARARSLQEHTWDHRLDSLFTALRG